MTEITPVKKTLSNEFSSQLKSLNNKISKLDMNLDTIRIYNNNSDIMTNNSTMMNRTNSVKLNVKEVNNTFN